MRSTLLNCLKHTADLQGIMVTGGTSGRLGQKIVTHLKNSHPVISTSSKEKAGAVHLPLTASADTMLSKIKDAKLVIHSGCLSKGSSEEIYNINVGGTKTLIQACKELDIPMLYLSSTAATVDGLSNEKTPYAHSKKEAETYAMANGIPVARVGILVGDEESNVTSLCHMAGVTGATKVLSVSVRTPDRQIQPIDYESAAIAITRIAEMILADKAFNEVIDVVGDTVSLHRFLDMINSSSIPINIKPKNLETLARLINDGAFTPEFIELSKQGYKIADNGRLREILGSDYKPVSKIADEARKETTVEKVMGIGKAVFLDKTAAEKKEILKAIIGVIRASKPAQQRNQMK